MKLRLVLPSCLALLATLLLTVAPAPEAAAQARPDIFGVGLMWHDWFSVNQLPPAYQGNPRSYDWAQMDLIVNAGGNACHGTFDWIGIEPTRGVYDWTRADQRVADAVARGLTMYAYIGNTPGWATPPNGLPGYRTPPDEAYAQDFMDYCTAVAARYAGLCDNFFFWNEPNGCSWINDGCGNSNGYPLYTHWLKRAYTALKAGNPNCTVGAGVLDYNEGVTQGWQYIQGIYNEGGGDSFDAIVIHPYASSGVHWNAIHDTRNVMVNNGDAHKKMWINEYGWANSGSGDAPQKLIDFLTQIKQPQYDYVTFCRYLVVSDLPGGLYGLADHDLNTRPIYNAFANFDKSFPTPGPTATPTPTPTPSPTPLPGTIANPGFEDGLAGWIGWQHYPFDGNGDDVQFPGRMPMKLNINTHIPIGGIARSGSNASGSDVGWSSARGGMYQVITVTPGDTYRLSFWGATGPDDEVLVLGWIDGVETWVTDQGVPGSFEELDSIGDGVNTYTELSGILTPTSAQITIYADWRHNWATGIGSCYVDDWNLENITSISQWSSF